MVLVNVPVGERYDRRAGGADGFEIDSAITVREAMGAVCLLRADAYRRDTSTTSSKRQNRFHADKWGSNYLQSPYRGFVC